MNRKNFLILTGIFLLGSLIRIIYLGADSYWFDEANTIGFTQWPMDLFFKHYYIQRPVYFLLLRLWVTMFGNSEFTARLLSVIFGSLSIVAVYKFVRLFLNEKIALFSAFILSVSFFHVLWSRAVMNYAFFCLISIVSSYCFVKYLKFNHKRDLIYYCISTLISIFTHPFALFLVLIQNILILYWHKKLFNFSWIISQFFIFLGAILLAWTIFFYPSFEATYTTRIHEVNYANPDFLKQHPSLSLYFVRQLYETFTFGGSKMGHGGDGFPVYDRTLPLGYALMFIYTIIFLLGFKNIHSCLKRKEKLWKPEKTSSLQKLGLLYIILSLLIPLGSVFIVNFWINPLFCERYFLFSYPFFITIMAVGIYKGIKLLWVRRSIMLTVGILSIIYSINHYIPKYHQTWRDIAVGVKNNIQERDVLVLIPFGQITSFWFYFEKDNKKALYNKTMDGIYKDGEWLSSFRFKTHPVVGNSFGKIDTFIQQGFFKQFYSEKRNIWLVMSPYWEEFDQAANKIYKRIKQNYRQTFSKQYFFNGVSVEKWEVKTKNRNTGF